MRPQDLEIREMYRGQCPVGFSSGGPEGRLMSAPCPTLSLFMKTLGKRGLSERSLSKERAIEVGKVTKGIGASSALSPVWQAGDL